MLPQEEMIARLRQICQQDERLVAAMLYGSFTRKEADQFSDIDVMLFFHEQALPEIDQQQWVSQIAPVAIYYINEFGNGTAIFDNLVRAEFHFDPASTMKKLEDFRGELFFPNLEDTLLVDKTGELIKHLQVLLGPPAPRQGRQETLYLLPSFLNWILFGMNVLARGELARSLEIQNIVHNKLLRMARLLEGKTANWNTATNALEREISPQAYQEFIKCFAKLDRQELWDAYTSMWSWGISMLRALSERYEVTFPEELIEKMTVRLQEHRSTTNIHHSSSTNRL